MAAWCMAWEDTEQRCSHCFLQWCGLFITRSVRRIPVPWVATEFGNVEVTPWECSFATLGSRLMVPKRVLKPAPQVVPALPPASVQPAASKLIPVYDEEAEAVKDLPPTPMEQIPDVLPQDVAMPAQAGSVPSPCGDVASTSNGFCFWPCNTYRPW